MFIADDSHFNSDADASKRLPWSYDLRSKDNRAILWSMESSVVVRKSGLTHLNTDYSCNVNTYRPGNSDCILLKEDFMIWYEVWVKSKIVVKTSTDNKWKSVQEMAGLIPLGN